MDQRVCSQCHVAKSPGAFGVRERTFKGGKKGEPTAKCRSCMTKEQERRQRQKRSIEEGYGSDNHEDSSSLDIMSLADFVDVMVKGIQESDSLPFKITARVNVGDYASSRLHQQERASIVAGIIQQYSQFHWTYECKCARKRSAAIVFSFSCAQSRNREHKPKVAKDKSRETRRMDRFDCDGWLHITVARDSDEVLIQLRHDLLHLAYVDIQLPEEWKDYIQKHAKYQTPGQIWRHILQMETHGRTASEIDLTFRAKSVYYYWHVISRSEWRLASDPLESARKYIQENGAEHVTVFRS